jgi:3'-phosphoadenosine 5'-phosphosulfate sulfotransferase (PAPS reductase)/FAD synthetase
MSTFLDDTLRLLAKRLYDAQRPTIWASGGKDSSALLHLCKPWAQKLRVLHTTKRDDDGWPGVTETLEQHCAEWGYTLEICQPWLTFQAYVDQYGWPVDTVPTTLEGGTAVAPSPYRQSALKLSSWLHCTYMRTLYSVLDASMTYKADLILTGSRLADGPNNAAFAQDVPFEFPMPWSRCNPLAAWTTAQVWEYIDTHQIALPEHYRWKRQADYEAVDCLSCTWQPQHWATLREHYPEEYAKRWPQVQPVYDELRESLQREVMTLNALPEGKRHHDTEAETAQAAHPNP